MVVETVTIVNKSGKIVSTGRHLANIFKDAKAAYHDRKQELKAEYRNYAENHNQARIESRSVTSHRSHRSRRSNRSQRHGQQQQQQDNNSSRPPLTARNLSHLTEESLTQTSTQSSHNPDHRSYRSTSPNQNPNQPLHLIPGSHHPHMPRRHTAGVDDTHYLAVTSSLPPPYVSRISRSRSNPDVNADPVIDMNLAYGHLPYDLAVNDGHNLPPEHELRTTIGRLDGMLLEARCLQHSATAIIARLQEDPEAMAAVALTLAELSTIVSKMSPSVIRTLQTVSPAIFALLASPQFLIATGVAMGATVVMFGGFHIIKKIQTNVEHKQEAKKLEAPMAYSGIEIDSITSWRRGVVDADAYSLPSTINEEYIAREAARTLGENSRVNDEVCSNIAESLRSKQTSRVASHRSSRPRSPSRVTACHESSHTRSPSRVAASETGSRRSRRSKKIVSDTSSQASNETKKKKKKKSPSILSTLLELKK